jgi:hypothetical protein
MSTYLLIVGALNAYLTPALPLTSTSAVGTRMEASGLAPSRAAVEDTEDSTVVRLGHDCSL